MICPKCVKKEMKEMITANGEYMLKCDCGHRDVWIPEICSSQLTISMKRGIYTESLNLQNSILRR